jgi:electron transfer flavoprotein beta subunit
LNIVVCIKQTPDTAATLTVKEGKASWGDAPLVLNPWDEFAVEEALRTREAHGGKVTAMSIGSEEAKEALKQALAMGCDEALLVSDSAFEGKDSLVISAGLAGAIRAMEAVDLVFCGRASVDSDTGVTAVQVARRLGWPSLSLVAAVSKIDPSGGSIEVERMLDEARQQVRGPLPAVVSVVKEINEPRYPSFMGIRKASKAEIPTWTLAQLKVESLPEAALSWPEVIAPPKVETHCEFVEGDSVKAKAAQLALRLIEEKVL